MYQQDYLQKIIEQLFTFIRKLLKIDFEKDSEKFVYTFNQMLRRVFKIDNPEIIDNLELNLELITSEENRDAFSLLFYKMAFILHEEDVVLSKKYFYKAEEISSLKIDTFSLFQNKSYIKEINMIKQKINYD